MSLLYVDIQACQRIGLVSTTVGLVCGQMKNIRGVNGQRRTTAPPSPSALPHGSAHVRFTPPPESGHSRVAR
jgi:hypothetical protein